MRRNSTQLVLVSLALLVSGASRVQADDDCCDHCGNHGHCRRVCRLVYEEKKVEVTCWGCKCEDFCVPCKSTPGCEHCEEVCGECDRSDPKAPYSKAKDFVWRDWMPGSAQMYTKKKLMKKTITKKVPGFKWVVEDLCEPCQTAGAAADAQQAKALANDEGRAVIPSGHTVPVEQAPPQQ
jgi:hypothetical protein